MSERGEKQESEQEGQRGAALRTASRHEPLQLHGGPLLRPVEKELPHANEGRDDDGHVDRREANASKPSADHSGIGKHSPHRERYRDNECLKHCEEALFEADADFVTVTVFHVFLPLVYGSLHCKTLFDFFDESH